MSSAKSFNCCGIHPGGERATGSKAVVVCEPKLSVASKTTQAIPFFNILWAELKECEITIRYARPASKEVVRVATISYTVDKVNQGHAAAWISQLLHRAYGKSERRKRIKVLINPAGGKGFAPKLYAHDIEPILAAAECKLDVETTQYQGHGADIAEKLNADDYDVIAACSGDGLPYEIFNGLGRKRDARTALSRLAVAQLPCGSGNAMCWSLCGTGSPSMAALVVLKGIRTPLDLVSITQGDRRTLSFLSQSFGLVAECDLDTEHLRWMGSARFTYGFLVRLLAKTVYPCDLAVKVEIATKPQIREHCRAALNSQKSTTHSTDSHPTSSAISVPDPNTGLPDLRYGTINDPLLPDWTVVPRPTMGTFWAGNMAYMAPEMNVFPASLPSDGYFDLVTMDGALPRSASLRSMLATGNNTIFEVPHVPYQKISGYRLIPRSNRKGGCLSIDGERYPFEPWQAEVHQGLGTVLSRNGNVYEAKGVV